MSEKTIDLLSDSFESVKKEVGTLMSTVKEFQDSNNEALKTNDALSKERTDKIEKSITESVEAFQKAQTEADARIKAMEAAINRADTGGEDVKLAEDRAKALDGWLRDSNAGRKELTLLDGKQAEAKAMSTDVNPDGGYLVRPEFSDFIVGRIFETSPLRRIANVETIGKKSLEMVIDDDEADVNSIAEGGTVTETDTPEVGILEITAHKYYAEPKVTDEMLEDAEFDVESWLQRHVARKIGRKENTDFIAGNGVGKAKGITSYAAWATAGTYERNKLEQVNSGHATLVQADGLIDLQNSLVEEYQANAMWIMRRATFGSVMKLKDGNNQYLFNMSLDKNTGLPVSNILTRPVMFASDMPAVAAGALAIAYGDFSVGYTIVDRRGIVILRDPYTSKGFVKFFTTKRTGGAVTAFDAIKIQKISA